MSHAAPAADTQAYLDARTAAFSEPLRALRSMPDWIEDALAENGIELPEEVRAHLSMMNLQAQRLDQLARDSARLEALALQDPVARPVTVDRLIRGWLKRYTEAELWEFAVEIDLPALMLDPALLESALCPLLENACVHGAGPGGRISVAAVMQDGAPVIWVEDDGAGMPEGAQPGTLFWTGAPIEAGGGSGLGLAHASRAATKLGGALTIGPAASGQGTRATISLPGVCVLRNDPGQ